MSDFILCTLTDIINAKKCFVGELIAWRETNRCTYQRCEAVLLVLVRSQALSVAQLGC